MLANESLQHQKQDAARTLICCVPGKKAFIYAAPSDWNRHQSKLK